jgi:hypothetical protein
LHRPRQRASSPLFRQLDPPATPLAQPAAQHTCPGRPFCSLSAAKIPATALWTHLAARQLFAPPARAHCLAAIRSRVQAPHRPPRPPPNGSSRCSISHSAHARLAARPRSPDSQEATAQPTSPVRVSASPEIAGPYRLKPVYILQHILTRFNSIIPPFNIHLSH